MDWTGPKGLADLWIMGLSCISVLLHPTSNLRNRRKVALSM